MTNAALYAQLTDISLKDIISLIVQIISCLSVAFLGYCTYKIQKEAEHRERIKFQMNRHDRLFNLTHKTIDIIATVEAYHSVIQEMGNRHITIDYNIFYKKIKTKQEHLNKEWIQSGFLLNKNERQGILPIRKEISKYTALYENNQNTWDSNHNIEAINILYENILQHREDAKDACRSYMDIERAK